MCVVLVVGNVRRLSRLTFCTLPHEGVVLGRLRAAARLLNRGFAKPACLAQTCPGRPASVQHHTAAAPSLPGIPLPPSQGAPPTYFIVAGLVFTPATVPYLRSEYGKEYDYDAPVSGTNTPWSHTCVTAPAARGGGGVNRQNCGWVGGSGCLVLVAADRHRSSKDRGTLDLESM